MDIQPPLVTEQDLIKALIIWFRENTYFETAQGQRKEGHRIKCRWQNSPCAFLANVVQEYLRQNR